MSKSWLYSYKSVCVLLIGILSTVICLCALCGLLPNFWFGDIASQFYIVYVPLLAIQFLFAIILKGRALTISVLVALVLVSIPLFRLFLPAGCEPNLNRPIVSILNFNTECQHNHQVELFKPVVERVDADIIVITEVDRYWMEALDRTFAKYPYRRFELTGPGLALFSKFPIESSEVRYFGKSHHPRILAKLTFASRSIQLMIVHPPTPRPGGFEERNQELAIIRDEIKGLARPVLLVGDLNCGPWSPAFEDLIRSGLCDSEQGFGPQPSWPARTGRIIEGIAIPPLVPIDHVLVSDDICVLERKTGASIESDHLPVFVKVCLREL